MHKPKTALAREIYAFKPYFSLKCTVKKDFVFKNHLQALLTHLILAFV